jgi:hypothetical protein
MLARGCVKVGIRTAWIMLTMMLIVLVVVMMMAITMIAFFKCKYDTSISS